MILKNVFLKSRNATMQCPHCKRFMRLIRDPVSSTDGGEYECRNTECPPKKLEPDGDPGNNGNQSVISSRSEVGGGAGRFNDGRSRVSPNILNIVGGSPFGGNETYAQNVHRALNPLCFDPLREPKAPSPTLRKGIRQ